MKVYRYKPARILIVLYVLIFLLSCAVPQPSRAPRRTEFEKRPRPAISIAELQIQIHSLINKERQKHGLSPLAWNETLSRIARKHSRDMAKRHYFSHYSPEGHDFSYRYKQEGYQCTVPAGANNYYTGAENIFQNNLYDRITTVNGVKYFDWNSQKKIAETTVEGWMHSQGHRKNILTPYWRKEGIGIDVSPDDKVYITENFC